MFDKILNEFSSPFYLYKEETIIAKTKLLKELNLNFNNLDLITNSWFVKYNKNSFNKAIENYNKVIELDKNYFKAHNNLGNIYRKKGLNKRAIECYLSTLEINSNYKVAYYNLAGVLQFYILDEENKNINKYLDLSNFQFISHDIQNHYDPEENIDCVIHLASCASPVAYAENPINTLKSGSIGTINSLGIAAILIGTN